MAKTSGRGRKGVKRGNGGGVPETLKLPEVGLVQSLLIKAQRLQLDDLGRQVGTPVVYLKAAWADPGAVRRPRRARRDGHRHPGAAGAVRGLRPAR